METPEPLKDIEHRIVNGLLECYLLSLEDIPLWEFRWFFSNCSFSLFSAVQKVFRGQEDASNVDLVTVMTLMDCELMEQFNICDKTDRAVIRMLLI